MKVAYYYHLALMGPWPAVLATGLGHLRGKTVHLGIVGDLSPEARGIVFDVAAASAVDVVLAASSPHLTMYEIPTLAAAQRSEADVVFYCHSKGVSVEDELRPRWARYMFEGCLRNEAKALEALGAGHNTAGVLWFTDSSQLFRGTNKVVGYYAGNFWYARADYLRTLPEIGAYFANTYQGDRFCAESWIGYGDARPSPLDGRFLVSVAEVVHQINSSGSG